jgi:hypothetical protein
MAVSVAPGEARWLDRYGVVLAGALAAYGMMGKGFAYLGVPPLFVTEALLAAGLLAMLHTRCALASVLSVPGLLLVALMAVVLSRTIPFVPVHGFDALRDSVVVMYGLFAFVTASLLLQRPARLARALAFLRWFTGVFVFVGPAVYLANNLGVLEPFAGWPAAGTPILFVRGGEVGVHLAACAVLALLGLRPAGRVWRWALVAGIALIASQNRGGMLAIFVPLLFALPFSGQMRRAALFAGGLAALLAVAYAADLKVPAEQREDLGAGARELGARQMVDNILSLVVPSDSRQLDDTKAFRLMWWRHIAQYTLDGPHFWTGKGFGVNLALDDGFHGASDDGPPLRSPHNSHMTILARAGVPGLVLWVVFLGSWMASVMGTAFAAWRRGERMWGNLLLFTACYWLANLVNAAFDVALEGPMLGVWFWVQTGFGMALVAIHRAATTCHAAAVPQGRATDGQVPERPAPERPVPAGAASAGGVETQ